MTKRTDSPRIRIRTDIPYLGAGGRGSRERGLPCMDAWLPLDGAGAAGPAGCRQIPACILIHGGGWTTGDKADDREKRMAADLCAMGYAVFSVNYHLAEYEDGPYRGKRTACAWPSCVMDCMDAVSYVRMSAARFGVDPERILAVGSSAGGHLALLLAVMGPAHPLQGMRRYPETPCGVCGAVSCYGVPDIAAWGGELLMPEARERMEAEWRLASPAALLDREPPPILLIHGDADVTVPLPQSEHFYRLLCKKGYKGSLMIVKGGTHSFDFGALERAQREELAEFLKTCFGRERMI